MWMIQDRAASRWEPVVEAGKGSEGQPRVASRPRKRIPAAATTLVMRGSGPRKTSPEAADDDGGIRMKRFAPAILPRSPDLSIGAGQRLSKREAAIESSSLSEA